MDRDAAFNAGHHLVLDADIGEGAAHHHFVMAAPRPVGIEINPLHPVRAQILARRRGGLDVARRGDVVRRDRVEEQAQHARALETFFTGAGVMLMPVK